MNILVVQRQSLVASVSFSLSVHARIVEAMEWLRDQNLISFATCDENSSAISKMLPWADAVVFCKHFSFTSIALARKAREKNKIVLLDIDDWVFDFPSYSGGENDASTASRISEMLDLAHVVTVANQILLDKVKTFCKEATFVPNGIYAEKYPSPSFKESWPSRIVFTNADFLKVNSFKREFVRVLQVFSAKHPEIIFDFYGDSFPELDSLPFMHYTNRIPYNDYMCCLSNSSYCFGIVPLGAEEDKESSLFNSCKNPFKYINYGLSGIPAIYSNASIYKHAIKDRETGILVSNDYSSWINAMEEVLGNKTLRECIVNNSREDILNNYHISKSADVYYKLMVSCVLD
jgi:glycosyltransferase involved in cell wall biosynthesis